jgi:hypothetical protein
MKTTEEILRAIDGISDVSELVTIKDYIINSIQRSSRRMFRAGAKVSFPGQNGEVYTGVIRKLNLKSVSVVANICDGKPMPFSQNWRVGYSFLNPVK